MKLGRGHKSLNFVMSMTLFAVFSLFLTLVLLTGASSFKSISEAVEERYAERTLLLYVSQKLRMSDKTGSVEITQFDGMPTLVLESGSMNIYIYGKNGYLNELYAWNDEVPDFNIGTEILPADDINFEKITPSLLKISIGSAETFINLTSSGSSGAQEVWS